MRTRSPIHYSKHPGGRPLGSCSYSAKWVSLNVDYSRENIIPKDDAGQAYIPYREPKLPFTVSTSQLCVEERE